MVSLLEILFTLHAHLHLHHHQNLSQSPKLNPQSQSALFTSPSPLSPTPLHHPLHDAVSSSTTTKPPTITTTSPSRKWNVQLIALIELIPEASSLREHNYAIIQRGNGLVAGVFSITHCGVKKYRRTNDWDQGLDMIAEGLDTLKDWIGSMLEQLSLLGKRIITSLVNELVGVVSDEKLLELLELAMSADTAERVKINIVPFKLTVRILGLFEP
ncbi:uncharacterized protein LOC131627859 [Vicia villosa]|uniref:uncharacterized protein LOC131627859 n=1 Tax=Vicia villosa TaxID=3911 RepID=UPI00273B9418|nr:uncharacterized protein LOC131627859 [Vicia villosa]